MEMEVSAQLSRVDPIISNLDEGMQCAIKELYVVFKVMGRRKRSNEFLVLSSQELSMKVDRGPSFLSTLIVG
jgi:hypothetical protein